VVADVRFLLWDFGDTLVDERFLLTDPDGVPDWAHTLRAVAGGAFGARWSCGAAGSDEFAGEMSARLGVTPDAVLAHTRRCCADIRFFDHAWTVASARALPQAIVTVNPDLFRDLIVPNYQLDSTFDVIVISAEEGTNDKADLCEVAAAQLGCVDPSQALLIDNIEANVDGWRSRGGAAYWFRGDEEFASRLHAGGWNGLAARERT
jgi:FMN phosphatase YigB (HAD superfamily)